MAFFLDFLANFEEKSYICYDFHAQENVLTYA